MTGRIKLPGRENGGLSLGGGKLSKVSDVSCGASVLGVTATGAGVGSGGVETTGGGAEIALGGGEVIAGGPA
ncbi:MAG: hypothetical protein EOO73_25195, partial [Myxococcales bacterium]